MTVIERKIYLWIGRIAFLIGMVAMLTLPQSCIKEDMDNYAASGGDGTGNTDVLLNIGVKSVISDDPNEGIRSIRIIATEVDDNGNETVRTVITDSPLENLAEYEYKLQQVERGTRLRFYVVCNEEMLPGAAQNYLGNYAAGQSVSGLAEYVVEDANPNNTTASGRCFPIRKEDIGSRSIPITGISEIVEVGRGDEYVNILVYYMVAKIQLDVTNNKDFALTLVNGGSSGMGEGRPGFSANRAFLFPQTNAIVPGGVGYALTPTYQFSENGNSYITLNPTTMRENLLVLYVYPSTVATGATYDMFVWANNNTNVFEGPIFTGTVLDRGTHLIANIGLGRDQNTTLQWEVKSWGTVNADIPVFN